MPARPTKTLRKARSFHLAAFFNARHIVFYRWSDAGRFERQFDKVAFEAAGLALLAVRMTGQQPLPMRRLFWPGSNKRFKCTNCRMFSCRG